MVHYRHGFLPECGKNPAVIILGSFPGIISLEKNEYYANKNNHFWKIMNEVAGVDIALPYKEKIKQLNDKKIALWDVASECKRKKSTDSSISDAVLNDIPLFIDSHKSIKAIILNGKTGAGRLFKKNYPDFSRKYAGIDVLILPSTSPANAAYSFEEKLLQWNVLKKYLEI